MKIEVDYADNPRIIAVGERAEVLYLRALCLAKRTLSDGFIDARQLPRFGLSKVQDRADALVREGLWRPVDQGYQIVGWSERNKAAAEIAEESAKRAEAGRLGGKRSGEARAQAKSKQVASTKSNTETETETETETRRLKDTPNPTSGESKAPPQAKKQGTRAAGTNPRAVAAREAEAMRPERERRLAYTFGANRRRAGTWTDPNDMADEARSKWPDAPQLVERAVQGFIDTAPPEAIGA